MRIRAPFTCLINRRRRSPLADRLAAFSGFAHLAQRADLENIRIVPALAERGVTEDEIPARLPLSSCALFPHDQFVCTSSSATVAPVVSLNESGPSRPSGPRNSGARRYSTRSPGNAGLTIVDSWHVLLGTVRQTRSRSHRWRWCCRSRHRGSWQLCRRRRSVST